MDNLSRSAVLASAALECERLCVTQNPSFGLIRMQTFHRNAGTVESLASRLGVQLPDPGSTRSERGRQWFWSAPGEWIIAVQVGTEEAVLAEWRSQLDGLFVVLSDISDSRVALDIAGPSLREVLARGSTADFHPTRFGAGSCVLTRFAGVPAMLACPHRDDQVLLFADRSLTRYLFDWFNTASIDCRRDG